MTKRTGLPSIVAVAHELCRLLVKFSPVIRRLYPENAILIAALDTALTACQALGQAAEDALPPGV